MFKPANLDAVFLPILKSKGDYLSNSSIIFFLQKIAVCFVNVKIDVKKSAPILQ